MREQKRSSKDLFRDHNSVGIGVKKMVGCKGYAAKINGDVDLACAFFQVFSRMGIER